MPRIPQLGVKQAIFYSATLAVVIEAVTVVLRFVFRLEASRDTASTVGRLSGRARMHHGYFGLLAILIAATVLRRRPLPGRWLLMVGIALVLSDLVHHFLILWPIVGSPQFHFLYP